ncbi:MULTISPECIES: EF-hand domain-containing protein [Streptomyces]|uniref:EF-hand domain-containing protein n=1 Tax=Streptomyces TaxID=1883 RepID=UPI00117EEAEE|nr:MULTISPECIES: EF-hand domain-containing protein [Streptomyces]UPT46758.1 EF-hand domain-containing protein [Streptomyces sp. WAC00303]WIY80875.1 EF-hand domain-containing protein [Streptomyces anulatus]
MDANTVTLDQFERWLGMADAAGGGRLDGRVSKEEWLAYAQSNEGAADGLWNVQEAAKLFDDLDTDQSGYLDYSDTLDIMRREWAVREASTLRVSKLKEPYPTKEVRIINTRLEKSTGGQYQDGVIKNVKLANESENIWEVTLYRPTYGSNATVYPLGSDLVVEATQNAGQANETKDNQRDKERNSWTN